MTSSSSIEEIVQQFDEKWPPFTGVGAPFPMFKDTPVRSHIVQWLRSTFTTHHKGLVEKITALGDGIDRHSSPGDEGYMTALDDVLALLKE